MFKFSFKKLSSKKASYWSQVCISCSQVFVGIFAVTLFAGKIDTGKIFVVLLNAGILITFFIIGSKLLK